MTHADTSDLERLHFLFRCIAMKGALAVKVE